MKKINSTNTLTTTKTIKYKKHVADTLVLEG